MALLASTGLRNKMLDTGALRTVLTLGFIKIYAGAVPTTANDSLGAATLLCTISNNSTGTGVTFAVTAANGAIAKSAEVWSGVNTATNTATFFRHVLSSDDGLLSTTQVRLQGTAGVTGTDLLLASSVLTSGVTTLIDSYSIQLPTLT